MRMTAQRPYIASNGGLAMLLIAVELLPGVGARHSRCSFGHELRASGTENDDALSNCVGPAP